MKQRGFTVIELLVVIVVLATIGIVFWFQFQNVQTAKNDDKRRTAINAMYYNLEDVFYTKNGYYPETISKDNLKAMDPKLFTDPNGVMINGTGSNYRYIATDCHSGGKCDSYTLRAELDGESDYVKRSRNS